ncbi:hypothetical protein C1I95_19850 [Micromonospora craterilacus]|uniref:Uncharacterized protein n=1 Tax=Micromonospora craterilacus TaxID=1655439 RepID=A0A2W2EEQ5_9ACTN|nr:hypothetical protein C1I95_19850 [Micromonospora craterilacus]
MDRRGGAPCSAFGTNQRCAGGSASSSTTAAVSSNSATTPRPVSGKSTPSNGSCAPYRASLKSDADQKSSSGGRSSM